MRIVSLYSSSKANSTYIENNGEGIVVDVGCSFKALRDSLAKINRTIDDVRAIFITHEHSDHIAGLFQITKNTDIPIYASEGTLRQMVADEKVFTDTNLHSLSELSSAPIDFETKAFHTPHDSAESVGYTFTLGDTKIAVCTDVGHVTSEVRENLMGSRFVLLESNYDQKMLLKNTKYPTYLKERICSDYGHLSNSDCGGFVRELIKSGTTSFLLGHLSQENNTPLIAYNNIISALSADGARINRDYLLEVAAVQGTGKTVVV